MLLALVEARWRWSKRRRSYVLDMVRYAGEKKLAPALSWVLGRLPTSGTEVAAAHFLERPAASVAASVRAAAETGTCSFVLLTEDRGSMAGPFETEVHLAARAAGSLCRLVLVKCASASLPPL